MSISTITVNHNDETEEVEIYVSGDDGTKSRVIAEHIMEIASDIQGENAKKPYEIQLN